MTPRILITREISIKQEEYCSEIGIEPIVKPFIRIANLSIDKEELKRVTENNSVWIFTSVNAVRAFSKYQDSIDVTNKVAYAIGEKTEFELRKIEGLNVILKDEYATNFFQEIKKENTENSIAYFCGDLSLEKNKNSIVDFNKLILYETKFLKNKVNKDFDAIAFFSPSAVNAFAMSENQLDKNIPVFAIGGVTMSEVFMHFQNTVIIPNEKKFEAVMDDVKNYFNKIK